MTFLTDSVEGAHAMAELHSVLWVENDKAQALNARHVLMERVRNRVHCIATVADLIAYLNGFAYYRDRTEYPLPGVIVLDLDLPGVDGFDALEWLGASAKFHWIPTIVIGRPSSIPDLQAAVRLGADAWMAKPLDMVKFRRIAHDLGLPVAFVHAPNNDFAKPPPPKSGTPCSAGYGSENMSAAGQVNAGG
jgi:CheY-like chemotaxis protein